MRIFLISLGKEVECYLVFPKRTEANFVPQKCYISNIAKETFILMNIAKCIIITSIILYKCIISLQYMSLWFLFFFFIFFLQPKTYVQYMSHKHHFSVTFLLKICYTILFTHLKITSLQYFQFSIFNCIQIDPSSQQVVQQNYKNGADEIDISRTMT